MLHNRHHLNASALIKNLPDSDVTFVLMRKETGSQEVAVKPLTQFPPEPFKDNPIDRYSGKLHNWDWFILIKLDDICNTAGSFERLLLRQNIKLF